MCCGVSKLFILTSTFDIYMNFILKTNGIGRHLAIFFGTTFGIHMTVSGQVKIVRLAVGVARDKTGFC